ncbi:MAG: redoxin domain-containing protein [Myxococcales bacterium]|nr:redoxin domain-containing protein [Myxococcales bacterium]
MGVHIVGVSFDRPSANQAWAEDQSYLFELWTDDDKTLAITYGAAADVSAIWADRLTMLLDAEGVLLVEYQQVSVGTHPAQVLEDCQAIFGD